MKLIILNQNKDWNSIVKQKNFDIIMKYVFCMCHGLNEPNLGNFKSKIIKRN